jgi:DNA mismatch repair protein MutS2
LRSQLQERLSRIEEERREIIEGARQEAHGELVTMQNEIADLRRRLRSLLPARGMAPVPEIEEVREIEEEVELLEEILDVPVEQVAAPVPTPKSARPAPRRDLKVGDRVFVQSLNAEGEVAAFGSGKEVEVQVGAMRVRANRRDLEWLPGKGSDGESDDLGRRYEPEAITLPAAESPGLELKLIGYTVDEASDVLDQYLDRAYRAGLPWVRIVHGKGSGILRKSIRDALHDHPLVKSFQRAGDSEGGDGVTVAMLAT